MAQHLLSWLRRARRACADRRGVSLAILAVSLTAMMGMLAVILDGGYAYGQKRMLQNAADAGVLAGLRTYWLGGYSNESAARAAAFSTACQYAVANGVPVNSGRGTCTASFETAGGVATMHVDVSKNWDTFFAGMLGRNTLAASVRSTAKVQGLKGTQSLWPLAVKEMNFQPCPADEPCPYPSSSCQTYQLWEPAANENPAPGNTAWIDWNREGGHPSDCDQFGDGANRLACYLRTLSASGYWQVGDMMPGQTGVAAGSNVTEAILAQQCKHVTVPIYNNVVGTGNNSLFQISNFAEFVVTDYDDGPNKHIEGHFIKWVDTGESTYTRCDPNTSYECTIHLVQN